MSRCSLWFSANVHSLRTAACVAEDASGMVSAPLFFLLSPPLLNLIDSEAIDYK